MVKSYLIVKLMVVEIFSVPSDTEMSVIENLWEGSVSAAAGRLGQKNQTLPPPGMYSMLSSQGNCLPLKV